MTVRNPALTLRSAVLSAAVVALGLWAYWPALHGGWIWDDYMYVGDNPALRSLAGLRSIWFAPPGVNYFPVTFTLQWVQWHLWGEAALGYHLTNLALHLANCFLLGRIVRRLGGGAAAGWTAAALFAVHPLAVESVAWISELKNALSLTLLLAGWSALPPAPRAGPRPGPTTVGAEARWGQRACPLILFTLAMLSKSTVAMFPAVLLLLAWWQTGRITRRDLLAAAPFAFIALALGGVTIWFEHHRTMAVAAGIPARAPARLAVAGMAVWFYLGKCLAPFGLMPNYARWDGWADVLPLGGAAWAALVALTLWLWTLRSHAAGRAALFAWAAFVLNLAPVLGIIPMAYLRIASAADHFAYLSLASVVGLVAAGFEWGVGWLAARSRGPGPRAAQAWGWGAVAGVVLVLALATRGAAGIYRSEEAFWTYAARENPQSWTAQSSLGLILVKQGRLAEAVSRYENELRINPDDAGGRSNLAALISSEPGRKADAIGLYESALRLKPDLPGVDYRLADLLASEPDRQEDAIRHYENALRLDPNSAGAHNNLAGVLFGQPGRQSEAIGHYETALRLDPNFAEAHNNLALLLARQPGRQSEAMAHYETALRLNPDYAEAHKNLGDLLAVQSNGQEAAIGHYESAIRLKPDFAQAQNNLGLLLSLQNGRDAEALTHLENAVRLQPNSFFFRYCLGRELAKSPRTRADAARQFEAAVRLNPNFPPAREALQSLR